MSFFPSLNRLRAALAIAFLFADSLGVAQQPAQPAARNASPGLSPEKLSYRIEWRLVTAGVAKLQLTRAQQNWQIDLDLQSAGLVSRLYHVQDNYKAVSNDKFCGLSSTMDAQEGKRHIVTFSQFDNVRNKLSFDERDLVKNLNEKRELNIAPCTYDITGALAALRLIKLDPGKSISMPIASGKKMAYAKVEAQTKENIVIDGKTYSTILYEAYVFDNVIFRRRGRLTIWMTDDAEHLPVQLRVQMGFPIGTITLELEKAEKL